MSVYSREQLLAESDHARPHLECGRKLHGGFDARGNYVSPRAKERLAAIEDWRQGLLDRGAQLLDCTTDLLREPNFPNEEQQALLLRNGLQQKFWDELMITGIIEARGVALAEPNFRAPEMQALTETDLSGRALGHLGKGLLHAHGIDEAGDPATGVGGHDSMWFLIAELLFGPEAFPVPQAPDTISREVSQREMPQLPPEVEGMMMLLLNLLMIEIRAERAFCYFETVIGQADLFPGLDEDRRLLAKDMVNRIRQDEAIHVDYLKVVLAEFRELRWHSLQGGDVSGAELLDPLWQKVVHWHAVENFVANRPIARQRLQAQLQELGRPELFAELEALAA